MAYRCTGCGMAYSSEEEAKDCCGIGAEEDNKGSEDNPDQN